MVEVFDLQQVEDKTNSLNIKYPARGGAVVARRAHNPKVVGSNPTPATKKTEAEQQCSAFLFSEEKCVNPKVWATFIRIQLPLLAIPCSFQITKITQDIQPGPVMSVLSCWIVQV